MSFIMGIKKQRHPMNYVESDKSKLD